MSIVRLRKTNEMGTALIPQYQSSMDWSSTPVTCPNTITITSVLCNCDIPAQTGRIPLRAWQTVFRAAGSVRTPAGSPSCPRPGCGSARSRSSPPAPWTAPRPGPRPAGRKTAPSARLKNSTSMIQFQSIYQMTTGNNDEEKIIQIGNLWVFMPRGV